MAAISGEDGAVSFTSGYATNVNKWEIEITAEALDTTTFSPSGGYKTKTVGLKDWRGSYECYIDDTTALPTAGDSGSATFTATTGRTYSGNIIVTSVRASVATDGSSRTLTVSFEGNGALTAA